jgi:hypothetical protein
VRKTLVWASQFGHGFTSVNANPEEKLDKLKDLLAMTSLEIIQDWQQATDADEKEKFQNELMTLWLGLFSHLLDIKMAGLEVAFLLSKRHPVHPNWPKIIQVISQVQSRTCQADAANELLKLLKKEKEWQEIIERHEAFVAGLICTKGQLSLEWQKSILSLNVKINHEIPIDAIERNLKDALLQMENLESVKIAGALRGVLEMIHNGGIKR